MKLDRKADQQDIKPGNFHKSTEWEILMTRLRSTVFLTIAFTLLLGSLAAQRHEGDAGQYVILNAQYGT